MKCKICGAELKKKGELCTNCMNKLMEQEEMRNDKSEYYTFKRKFILGYELLRHCEQIGIMIFTVILIVSINISYWKYSVAAGCVFIIFGIAYLLCTKLYINSGVCTLYRTRLVFSWRKIKKRVKEIPFSQIDEIYYTQNKIEKLFGLGTIVIKQKTRNVLDKFVYIECVKNVEEVFGKIKEVFK